MYPGLTRSEIWLIKFMYRYLLKSILSQYGNNKIKILGVGAGPGITFELTRKYMWDVICLDKKDYASQGVIPGDVMYLPFKDESFDVVISRASFSYWKNKKKALSEIIRVLKQGQYFFIMGMKRPNALNKRLIILIDRWFFAGKEGQNEIKDYIAGTYAIDEVKALLANFKENIDLKIKTCLFNSQYILIGRKL